MQFVKIWNKKRERWFCSQKGRDMWFSVGKAKAVMKTSYFPDYGCHMSDYEFVVFDCIEKSRVEV